MVVDSRPVPSMTKVVRSVIPLFVRIVEMNALALFPYAADWPGGMGSLLRRESVPETSLPEKPAKLSELNSGPGQLHRFQNLRLPK